MRLHLYSDTVMERIEEHEVITDDGYPKANHVLLTMAELRARDERLIRAAFDWMLHGHYVESDWSPDFDAIIVTLEQETPHRHPRTGDTMIFTAETITPFDADGHAWAVVEGEPNFAPTTSVGMPCDWGYCDAPSVAHRWSPGHGWLPVCSEHSDGVQVVPGPPAAIVALDKACERCGGRGFQIGGGRITNQAVKCPDCIDGRHTFEITVPCGYCGWDTSRPPGMIPESSGGTYLCSNGCGTGTVTRRVSIVPGMVLPIIENSNDWQHGHIDHIDWMGGHAVRRTPTYGFTEDTEDITLPPAAKPGMFVMQLKVTP